MRIRRWAVWWEGVVVVVVVSGRVESGFESVSVSSLGSHSSSSVMASFRRLWYVSSLSIASAGRPVDASLVMLSQVSQRRPVAARASRSRGLSALRSSCGIVARSADKAPNARERSVRRCWWRRAE